MKKRNRTGQIMGKVHLLIEIYKGRRMFACSHGGENSPFSEDIKEITCKFCNLYVKNKRSNIDLS